MGMSGHKLWKIRRLTWPCSRETELAFDARRRDITAMLKCDDWSPPGSWPIAMNSSKVIPHSSTQVLK
jgi:hypothetical protein